MAVSVLNQPDWAPQIGGSSSVRLLMPAVKLS